MDTIDYKIINILITNGRISHEAIAKEVGLSRPAVRQRIISMENIGIINGYKVNINYDLMGFSLNVFIYLKLNNTTFKEAVNSMKLIKQDMLIVDSYFRLAGEWCLMLQVMSKTQTALTNYIDNLLKINGIVASNTVFMFKT